MSTPTHPDEGPLDEAVLDGLRRRPEPPPALEDRVVAALAAEGRLGSRAPARRRWLGQLAALAASGAAFVLGRASASGPPAAGDGRARWMFLLYEDEGYAAPTADEAEARVQEYVAWARALARQARYVDGAELAPGAAVVAPPGRAPRDPRSEGPQLAGYFVVGATDLADARQLAESCPHVRYGGSVVIRPLVQG